MKTAVKGFIPVMLTPFTNTGDIDFRALNALTEFYLEKGAVGLFANCLSSEMVELTDAERLAIIKHVVDVSGQSVPVVATGTFGGPIREQADFVWQVYAQGVDAVILITGLLAQESDSDAVFDQNVAQLLDLTPGIPLGFYECPVPYKRLLSAEQLARWVRTGRVIYHKDTSLDIGQIREKLAATAQYPAFGLYDAYMAHAVASLQAGSAGLSCIQGNFFPELVSWLCRYATDSSFATDVSAVQAFLTRQMEVMHHVYPTIAKYYLQKRGLPLTTYTRRAVGAFTPQIRADMDTLFDEYETLRTTLGIA